MKTDDKEKILDAQNKLGKAISIFYDKKKASEQAQTETKKDDNVVDAEFKEA